MIHASFLGHLFLFVLVVWDRCDFGDIPFAFVTNRPGVWERVFDMARALEMFFLGGGGHRGVGLQRAVGMFKTRGGCGTPCIRTFLLNYRVHISRTEHLRARHGSRLLLQNTRIPTTRSVVGCKVLIDRAEGGVTPRTRVGSRSVLSLHTVGQSALGLLIIAVTHQPVAGVPTRTTCLPTQFDGIAVGTGTMMVVVFDYCLPSPGHPPGKRRHSWDFVVPSTEVPIAFPKGGGVAMQLHCRTYNNNAG